MSTEKGTTVFNIQNTRFVFVKIRVSAFEQGLEILRAFAVSFYGVNCRSGGEQDNVRSVIVEINTLYGFVWHHYWYFKFAPIFQTKIMRRWFSF